MHLCYSFNLVPVAITSENFNNKNCTLSLILFCVVLLALEEVLHFRLSGHLWREKKIGGREKRYTICDRCKSESRHRSARRLVYFSGVRGESIIPYCKVERKPGREEVKRKR